MSIKLGKWTYDQHSGELQSKQTLVRLPNQQNTLLAFLVQKPAGQLVSREDVIQHLWPDGRVVEYDQSLNACIRKLRKALGDSSEQPEYIETLAGKGYRLKVTPKGEQSRLNPIKYAIVAAVLLLILIVGYRELILGDSTTPRIAVLPVNTVNDNIGALRLRDSILSQINRIPIEQLIVLAPESVDQMQDNPELIKQPLFWLTMSLNEDPLNTHVHVRITDQADQQLWARSFSLLNGAGNSVYQQLAQDIVAGISDTFDVSIKPTQSASFYLSEPLSDTFNQGVFLTHQSDSEQWLKAIDKFQDVLSVHQDYTPALVYVAQSYKKLASMPSDQQAVYFKQSSHYAEQAIQLEPLIIVYGVGR